MSFLSFIYRNGLWISVPVFVLSAALLIFFILSVIRGMKQAHLLRVPLQEEQEVEFAEAGPVVLCTQGPQLSLRFAKLEYELTGDGIPVEAKKNLLPKRTTGISWVRLELQTYDIPRPGRYLLRVRGLEAERITDPEHWVLFMRPHFGKNVLHVIGIVLSGLLFIGSIVLFFLRLLSKQNGV